MTSSLFRERAGVLISRVTALVLIITVVGLLPWLSGRDAALSVLRARSAEQEPTKEALDSIRRELGLDSGPLSLLGDWFGGVVRGDFGRSWANGSEVLPSVLSGLGASLTLMGAALVVTLLLAGALCARTLVRGARGTLRGSAGSGAPAAALAALPEFRRRDSAVGDAFRLAGLCFRRMAGKDRNISCCPRWQRKPRTRCRR